MKISEVMHTPVVTCPSWATLGQVARVMRDKHVGCVLLTDRIGYLAGIVTETLDGFSARLKKEGFSVEVRAPSTPLPTAWADRSAVTQVLTNLVVNGIQATPAGGTVAIAAKLVEQAAPPFVESDEQTWMAIAVTDTGIGLEEAHRARIFEPFFTTKEVGTGTGLGLSVSWGLVREHGGWIDVQSTPGEGSTFTVYLPRGAA